MSKTSLLSEVKKPGKKTFSTAIVQDKQDTLRLLAALKKQSIEDLIDEALELLFEKHHEEVRPLRKIPRAS
ncbi:MAG: hypothetical protein K1Y36_17380 [Blastocatellia bacterium]|nr:hypothetical protein [Blastocatellia bacterium]